MPRLTPCCVVLVPSCPRRQRTPRLDESIVQGVSGAEPAVHRSLVFMLRSNRLSYVRLPILSNPTWLMLFCSSTLCLGSVRRRATETVNGFKRITSSTETVLTARNCGKWNCCFRNYTVSQKQDTKLLPITSPNINRFSIFFR